MTDYDFAIEPDRSLFRMTMRGYWDAATFARFERDFHKALGDLARRGGARNALVDCREFAVQSTAIAQKFGLLVARCKAQLPPRTATLVAGTLNKLQSDRAGVDARYFTDAAEAETWLLAPELSRAAG